MSARASSANVYKIFPTSLYRLGMFDHDSTPRANHAEWTQAFDEQLKELADYVETELIRLWSDLERDPGKTNLQAIRRLPAGTLLALQRPVRLGALQGDVYPVLSGINASDRVILNGSAGLRHGSPIRLKR